MSDDAEHLYEELAALVAKDNDDSHYFGLYARALRAAPKLSAPDAARLHCALFVLGIYEPATSERLGEAGDLVFDIRNKAVEVVSTLCAKAEKAGA